MTLQTRLAVHHLKRGGVISHPSDTIQSLSCLPVFESSIKRILQLKCRAPNKGLILLASDLAYFANFVADSAQLASIKNSSIPTTYLLKVAAHTSKLLTGEFDTIALRLTDNDLITQLCKANNSALVSTSANISGKQCVKTMLELKISFAKELDFMIAPKNYNNQPSRIINCQTGERLR